MMKINAPLILVIAMKVANMINMTVITETNAYHSVVMLKKVANMRPSKLMIPMLAQEITATLTLVSNMMILLKNVTITLNVLTIVAIPIMAVLTLQLIVMIMTPVLKILAALLKVVKIRLSLAMITANVPLTIATNLPVALTPL
jgi:hypothetical protein